MHGMTIFQWSIEIQNPNSIHDRTYEKRKNIFLLQYCMYVQIILKLDVNCQMITPFQP
jgi:hypothetical protein